jgi:hypothetical protein
VAVSLFELTTRASSSVSQNAWTALTARAMPDPPAAARSRGCYAGKFIIFLQTRNELADVARRHVTEPCGSGTHPRRGGYIERGQVATMRGSQCASP